MSDFIGADDTAVSDCIDAEIMAIITGATEVYPRSYEYANPFASTVNQQFAVLQSSHRRSASINAVVAKGAEFAYFKTSMIFRMTETEHARSQRSS